MGEVGVEIRPSAPVTDMQAHLGPTYGMQAPFGLTFGIPLQALAQALASVDDQG